PPLVAAGECSEAGDQADQEIVTCRRQTFAPADQSLCVARRALAVQRATGIAKRRRQRCAVAVEHVCVRGPALVEPRSGVAQVSFDPRRRQPRTWLCGTPDGSVPQAELDAARAGTLVAAIEALADLEQISQVDRPPAREAERCRPVGVRAHRQQGVAAGEIAGPCEHAVNVAAEWRSRNEIADRFDRQHPARPLGLPDCREAAFVERAPRQRSLRRPDVDHRGWSHGQMAMRGRP
ncbi:MAG TPA: hypothetical protein VGI48_09260, partial [Caldimonas sp.]